MSSRLSTVSRMLACAAVAGSGLLASGTASALVLIPAQSTFYLTGTCSDCTLNSHPLIATLVLENYTPGSVIDETNFLALAYHGSNLIDAFTVSREDTSPALAVGNPYTYVIDSNDSVSGYIGANGGASSFRIEFQDGIGLETTSSGTWFACAPGNGSYYSGGTCDLFRHNDVGIAGWSSSAPPVPEPATLLMMATGVAGLAGWSARRRSRPQR